MNAFLICNIYLSTPATQIFVAPDGDIKFEIGEIPVSSNSNSPIETLMPTQITTIKTEHQISPVGQMTTTVAAPAPAPAVHPVKKRNLATVTKCTKCNGSGVIIVGGNPKQKHLHQGSVSTTTAATTTNITVQQPQT